MIRAGHDFEANLSTGRWLVIVEEQQGLTLEQQGIVIKPVEMNGKNYMDTCVHEALHASQPDLTEAEVTVIAGDIVEILWKRGYRLPKQKKVVEKD